MFQQISIQDTKINIGDWCKQNRQKNNLSQEALAEFLGISRITIQKLENGNNVTLDTLLKVVNHFDALNVLNDFLFKNISDNSIKSLY